MLKEMVITADLCVVGGGLAGMCAAIRGAREGLKVVLMHERPVLGGNASSEIRMWVCGADGEDNRETGIIEEICLENMYRNPTKNYYIWDTILYEFVKREENLTLLLNCTCMEAETEEGTFSYGRTVYIKSITGYQMTTQTFFKIKAQQYADCSGDSILAPLTGAEYMLGREGKGEFGEEIHREKHDETVMGMSCLIQARETIDKIPFIPPEWSRFLTEQEKKSRRPEMDKTIENFWYLELGGERNTIEDTENIRDDLIPLTMGMWDYVKNGYGRNMDKWELEFLGFLPGKRESRRMTGEYVLTQKDICRENSFEDAVAYGGWAMDDHYPGGFFYEGSPNKLYQVYRPYQIPYRCLYSKNVENLFFAGRNISATHLALSSTRVMATCALLGEAAGAAASIAVRQHVSPQGVYLNHMEKLQQMLMNGDCFIPGKRRMVSKLCMDTKTVPETLKYGIDRNHIIYKEKSGMKLKNDTGLKYEFEKEQFIDTIHLVFDSDLNRMTLEGDKTERSHIMRANVRLDSPKLHMPTTLCKEFFVTCEGKELYHITNNRKRCVRIPIKKEVKDIELTIVSNWGKTGETAIISFDFL